MRRFKAHHSHHFPFQQQDFYRKRLYNLHCAQLFQESLFNLVLWFISHCSFVSTAETAEDESFMCSGSTDSISPDLHGQTSVMRGQSCQGAADRLLPNIDEAKQKHKALHT